MKHFLISVALLLLSFADANSKVKVYGKIVGHDGKPTKLAHISKYGDNSFFPIATADSEGNYSLYVDEPGINTLSYYGTFHFARSVKFFIPSDAKEVNLNVQLPPIVIKDPSNLKVIGSFNMFSFDSTAIPLTLKDGKYSANVPNLSDTLKYQLVYNFSGSLGVRSFNGSQADFFTKDDAEDFYACIQSPDKNVLISFDSSAFAKQAMKSTATSSDSIISKSINTFIECDKLIKNYYYNFDQQIIKKNQDSIEIVTLEYVDKMIAKFADEKNSIIRALYIYNLFEIIPFVTNTKSLADRNIGIYAQELIKAFDYKNNIWDNYYYLFCVIDAIESPYTNSYYQSVIAEHPNPNVRDLALYKLLEWTASKKYSQYKDEYFEKYKTQFPNGRHIKTALRKYSPERAITIGKLIPNFKLPRLENLNDTLTHIDLRGKYTLVDVWGTWCASCRSEMPYLDSAFNMFKDKNFNIISIAFDKSPEAIQKFREGKWKMPWTHAFATGMYENPIADSFQITGVPSVFLIDPQGKIIETEDNLRGDDLIPTLRKYLK